MPFNPSKPPCWTCLRSSGPNASLAIPTTCFMFSAWTCPPSRNSTTSAGQASSRTDLSPVEIRARAHFDPESPLLSGPHPTPPGCSQGLGARPYPRPPIRRRYRACRSQAIGGSFSQRSAASHPPLMWTDLRRCMPQSAVCRSALTRPRREAAYGPSPCDLDGSAKT